MRLQRLVEKMFRVEPGHVAKEIVVTHQHESAVHARPNDRRRRLGTHRVGNHAGHECATNRALPECEDLMTQIHHALKIAQLRLPFEPFMKLRINHRMLRQKNLARLAQIIEIGGSSSLKFIKRLKPARKNLKIPTAQLLPALRNQTQVQIIARRVIEIDSPNSDLSLARNHLNSRALQPMLRENGSGASKYRLPTRPPLPTMPLLNAHLVRPRPENE